VFLNRESLLDTAIPFEAWSFAIATKVKTCAETATLTSENSNANIT
jgi:hypothetical protein